MKQSVQVYSDYLCVVKDKKENNLYFKDIDTITIVGWSLFYVKMKSGYKQYFNSGLERVDYIWEGIKRARPELISDREYEEFRVNLVQYDHHQKRKEWFFKNKFADIFNWIFLPSAFVLMAFLIQSKEIIIYQQGLYFFRLFMYALIVLLFCSFICSFLLKKFVFDKRVHDQIVHGPNDKLRDLKFEGVILQRSKLFQIIMACFIFTIVIKTDMNFYSVAKLKIDSNYFKIKPGTALLVDNRYNCLQCKYQLVDGDMIVFGRGLVGQIMAREGEFVGEVSQDKSGRAIASSNIQEVPNGHIAVKVANGKDIMFVRIDDLIGKIQK